MGEQAVAIVGRNGMGKTTLCAAIVGFSPPRTSGSIVFEGAELLGKPAHKIARARHRLRPAGTAPVPVAHGQRAPEDRDPRRERRRAGRRPDLRALPAPRRAAAERRRQLSGGEQQMLAIGRALLGNPKLLIMDEPSEGLAPAIIEMLVETFKTLEEQGLAILLIEQKLDVATSLAERQLVMVGGRDRGRDDCSRARWRHRDAAQVPRRRAGRRIASSPDDDPARRGRARRDRHGDRRYGLRRVRRGTARSRLCLHAGTATTRSSR